MKKIKLTEEAYNKLVNEISHGTVRHASDLSDDIFTEMKYAFNDFYDTVKYNADTENPYVNKIKEHADAIAEILARKTAQHKNFDDELGKFDYEKFYDDNSREEEDYDGSELMDLQKKYPKNI